MMLVPGIALLLAFTSIPCPAEAWYQTISTDAPNQLHLRTHQHEDENCVSRSPLFESVLGILNVVGSRQLHALALYIGGDCERDHPDRYSLFVHFYDEPQAIQLVDLGIPGLEHSWSAYRGIDPDSDNWINYGIRNLNYARSTGIGEQWYQPQDSGRTPVGEFYARLLDEVPPGSIRYKIEGTDQYITAHNVVKIATGTDGQLLIPDPDTILTPEEIEDAIHELRYNVRLYYAETGGRDRHSVAQQRDQMNENLRQEFLQKDTSQLLDFTNRDPRIDIVSDRVSGQSGQTNIQGQTMNTPNMGMNQPPLWSEMEPYSPFQAEDIYAPDPFQRPEPRSPYAFDNDPPPLGNMMVSPIFDWVNYVYKYRGSPNPTQFDPQLVAEVIGDITAEYNRITSPQQRTIDVDGFAVPRPRTNVRTAEQLPQNAGIPLTSNRDISIEEDGLEDPGFEKAFAEQLAAERAAMRNGRMLDEEINFREFRDDDYWKAIRDIDFETLGNEDAVLEEPGANEADFWPEPQINIEDQAGIFSPSSYFEEEIQDRAEDPSSYR
ncbi:hypothetical protein TWF696_000157 [Orbilia brochopaga]|uniref:Uncharacterized protein n=1 Tax=Orbilia brochopaga TaxID=3140254 RepID=A0AAV9VAK5_9PEZI